MASIKALLLFFAIEFAVLPPGNFASVSKTMILGKEVTFSCDSPGIPIWMVQNEGHTRMHGIGVGTTKQSNFKNPRLGRFLIDIFIQLNPA